MTMLGAAAILAALLIGVGAEKTVTVHAMNLKDSREAEIMRRQGYDLASPEGYTYVEPEEPSKLYSPPTKKPSQYGPLTEPPSLYGPPTELPSLYGPPTDPPSQYGPPTQKPVPRYPPLQDPNPQYGPPAETNPQYGPPEEPVLTRVRTSSTFLNKPPEEPKDLYQPPSTEYQPPTQRPAFELPRTYAPVTRPPRIRAPSRPQPKSYQNQQLEPQRYRNSYEHERYQPTPKSHYQQDSYSEHQQSARPEGYGPSVASSYQRPSEPEYRPLDADVGFDMPSLTDIIPSGFISNMMQTVPFLLPTMTTIIQTLGWGATTVIEFGALMAGVMFFSKMVGYKMPKVSFIRDVINANFGENEARKMDQTYSYLTAALGKFDIFEDED